jgi:hypothetical protein
MTHVISTEVEVFKKTHDEWYPSYGDCHASTGPLVRVVFREIEDDVGQQPVWVVSAFGIDDFGLERMFDVESDAMKCFIKILHWRHVDQEPLQRIFNFEAA